MTLLLNRSDRDISHAAALLAAGELVAFGTETVYGLGADARNAGAVAKIFEAKGRPHFNPLICHYATAEAAFADVHASDVAERLAEMFWPGPLTMVLRRRATCQVALLAGAGLETLAIRVPAHGVAQRLLAAFGGPVAAPSANRSGRISPTTAAHVMAQLAGRIAAVLESGSCRVGVESSVVDLSGDVPVLLRPGGVSLEALRSAIGEVRVGVTPGQAEAPRTLRSPGLLVSHYAPVLPLRMAAVAVGPDEGLLAFGAPLAGSGVVFQLSESGSLHEAAARLFEGLHWLDERGAALGLRGIAAMAVPGHGLGLAVNDRLARAAAGR